MKKGIVGLFAVGAIIGSRPLARRMGRRMRERCGQMMARCEQTAAQPGGRGEAVGKT